VSARKRIALGFLVSLGMAVGIGPLLIPLPPLPDTVPPQELADPDSRFLAVNGLKVHYKMAGRGEPVFVLLHGFGASVFSWRKVMPELAASGTAVAYDRPAFGLTERPLRWQGPNPYALETQVDLLIGLMDALGVRRAILMGHSAGARVAFQTALTYPERVQALVAVGPAIYAGEGVPTWLQPVLRLPQARRLGLLIVRELLAQRGDALIRSAWHDPRLVDAETIAGYRKPLRVENWDQALWELVVAGRPSRIDDRLEEITVPVLVITGDDDRLVPPDQSQRLARALPDARFVILPNCGHVPQEECPEAFMQAVRQHFNFLAP
jgi:pimeloyl-ACP methyl ester carboxylesterase